MSKSSFIDTQGEEVLRKLQRVDLVWSDTDSPERRFAVLNRSDLQTAESFQLVRTIRLQFR